MDKFLESIEKNKVAVIIIGVLAAALVFVGVSNKDNNSTPVAVDPYVAPQDMDTNPSNESGYLNAVRSVGNPVLAVGSNSELLDMGYNVCNALDSGQTVASIAITVGAAQDSTAGQEAAYAVIAGAVLYICPEYKYQAEALGN